MIHLLIYVNVTFKSYLVLCKGFNAMDFPGVGCTQFLITIPWCVSCYRPRASASCKDDLAGKSQGLWDVTKTQWLCCSECLLAWNGEWLWGLSSPLLLCVLFTLYLSCTRGRPAGSVQERPEAGLPSGVVLAEHFPGMLAPSAQAENFASANCDFRTQVCSWTWTPSCQCVAICHQHMAP